MSELAPRYRLTAPPPAREHQDQAALFRFAAIRARRDPRWDLLNASQNGLPGCLSAGGRRRLSRAVHRNEA